MKQLALPFALLYFSFSAPAAETFFENFNFGILDKNLTAQADQYFSYTITTNGDGTLLFQKWVPSPVPPPTTVGEASVATTFDAIGDFTTSVTASPAGNLGIRMFTADGYAEISFGGNSSVSLEINFPASKTNVGWSIPITWPPKYLVIRRSGATLYLEFHDENNGLQHWVSATDPSLASPARFKLYLRSNVALGGGGWFDDLVIEAEHFTPRPTPRLFAQIVPVAFQISWPSYSNAQYQVWYRGSLTSTVWTALGPRM